MLNMAIATMTSTDSARVRRRIRASSAWKVFVIVLLATPQPCIVCNSIKLESICAARTVKNPSANLQTLLAYFDGLRAWDFAAIMDAFDESLEHHILPHSLKRPVLTKKQYGDYFAAIMPMFKRFEPTIHELIEVEDKITVHASSNGVSASGSPYANEYIMIFHFVPGKDGGPPKIDRVKEFVDSLFSSQWFKTEREKMQG